MSQKVTDQVAELLTDILEKHQLELVDVEYVKEGKNWFLRVFIDKETGVDIEECSVVSEQLSEKLDETDPIPHVYFLEVSSPGAERPLKNEKDFVKSVGKYVNVKTYEPIEGSKEFEGTLLSYDAAQITLSIKIKTRTKEISIPTEKVAKARLAVTFS